MNTVQLCLECEQGEVNQVWIGDEGWGICEECGATEQSTKEVTIEEYEQIINSI